MIEAQRAVRAHTSPEAMDYVMRGRALALRPGPQSKDDYRQQQEMFERALQLDDYLAAAQLGLANTLAGKLLDDLSDAPEADLQRANDLVSKVLAVDSNNSLAHMVKAQILRSQAIHGMQDRFQQAIVEYETVIALDHNNAPAFSALARTKTFVGLPGEAIPLLEQALRISPRDPNLVYIYYRLGVAHLLLGHMDEAIQWYQKIIPSYPSFAVAYVDLAAALGLKGDKVAGQAAFAEFQRHTIRHKNDTTIAKLKRWLDADSKDPKYLALRERTIWKGLRKAGVPEQ